MHNMFRSTSLESSFHLTWLGRMFGRPASAATGLAQMGGGVSAK